MLKIKFVLFFLICISCQQKNKINVLSQQPSNNDTIVKLPSKYEKDVSLVIDSNNIDSNNVLNVIELSKQNDVSLNPLWDVENGNIIYIDNSSNGIVRINHKSKEHLTLPIKLTEKMFIIDMAIDEDKYFLRFSHDSSALIMNNDVKRIYLPKSFYGSCSIGNSFIYTLSENSIFRFNSQLLEKVVELEGSIYSKVIFSNKSLITFNNIEHKILKYDLETTKLNKELINFGVDMDYIFLEDVSGDLAVFLGDNYDNEIKIFIYNLKTEKLNELKLNKKFSSIDLLNPEGDRCSDNKTFCAGIRFDNESIILYIPYSNKSPTFYRIPIDLQSIGV